jgi:uncharacterized protein YegJ (DUF2314 family)
MMLKTLALSTGLSLALLAPAFAQDPTINYEPDDPAMNAAIAEAQATLPLFFAQAFDTEGNSVEPALVKVAFPALDGYGMDYEHIWISPFARMEDGSFTGLLANEPVALGDLMAGDQVDFTAQMITDWHMTAPSGLFWGSFTSRVMYDQGAFGDTPFDQIFETEPVPTAWN